MTKPRPVGAVRTLTVKQPWATMIARNALGHKARGKGIKDIENRSWKPKDVGQRIAIHAGSGTDREGLALYAKQYPWLLKAVEEDRGRVLCTVVIEDYLLPALRKRSEWHHRESIGWVLSSVVPVRSEPVKGKLGFWWWTPS